MDALTALIAWAVVTAPLAVLLLAMQRALGATGPRTSAARTMLPRNRGFRLS